MDEDETLMALGFLLIRKRRRKRNKPKVKKNIVMWVRDIYKQREEKGAYHTLVQEFQLGGTEIFKQEKRNIL